MELKEGMYVRFFNGDIGKIANYEYKKEYVNGHVIYLEKDDTTGWCCEKKDFKASYNITDLIEVGDRIKYELSDIKGWFYIETKEDLKLVKTDFKEKDIKSIVTKEQFESMSYKVGE